MAGRRVLKLPPMEIGETHPWNLGASRRVSDEIAKEMESVVLADRLIAHLLDEFVREHGMNGPEGHKVRVALNLHPEVVVIESTPPARKKEAASV